MCDLDRIKGIIFDKDGTLLDFDAFWVTVARYSIEEILQETDAEEIPVDEMLQAIGVKNGTMDIMGILCYGTYRQTAQAFVEVMARYGKDASVDKMEKITVDAFTRNAHKGQMLPNSEKLIEVLEALKNKGIKLFVVTADAPVMTKKCLDKLGITELFERIYTDDGVHPPKPDPYCVEDICSRYNLPKCSLMMVGDTLVDAGFASNGRIAMVGVAKTQRNRDVLAPQCDYVIEDLSCLLQMVR